MSEVLQHSVDVPVEEEKGGKVGSGGGEVHKGGNLEISKSTTRRGMPALR